MDNVEVDNIPIPQETPQGEYFPGDYRGDIMSDEDFEDILMAINNNEPIALEDEPEVDTQPMEFDSQPEDQIPMQEFPLKQLIDQTVNELSGRCFLPNGAYVAPTARILGNNVTISDNAIISDYCVIHDNTYIGDFVYIGPGSVIGTMPIKGTSANTTIISDNTTVGSNCIVEKGCTISKNLTHNSVVKVKSLKQRLWTWFRKRAVRFE